LKRSWPNQGPTVPDWQGRGARATRPDTDAVKAGDDGVGTGSADGVASGAVTRLMLGALGCAIDGRVAVYVSAPITTGRRFVDWRLGPGADLSPADEEYARQHRQQVVVPNCVHVKPLVARCRQRFGGVVIDPTALDDVTGWTQRDYHRFWALVIERFAATTVFVDGWEFSRGCTLEFVEALRTGSRMLREDLSPLRPEDGVRLIERAAAITSRNQLTAEAAELIDSLERLRHTLAGEPGSELRAER
jgi:hypothetical protein